MPPGAGRPEPPLPTDRIHDPLVLQRLDRALLRMRRSVVRPEITVVPIPALDRSVDLAKVMACLAVSDLNALADPHPTVSVKDVAAALELDHSTASRLLVDMEAEGLIARSSDPVDRRRTVVELTSTGQAVVQQSSAIRTWAIDLMLAEWSETDLAEFTRLVERFGSTVESRMRLVIEAAIERVSHPGPAGSGVDLGEHLPGRMVGPAGGLHGDHEPVDPVGPAVEDDRDVPVGVRREGTG